MQVYILRRLIFSIPVLLVVTFMAFMIVRLIPGDIIALKIAGAAYKKEDVEHIRNDLGLDRPIPVQYGRWLGGILFRGLDFGDSFWTKAPIRDRLQDAFPVTAQLAIMAMFFSIIIALPIGVISAIRQDSWADYGLRFSNIAFLSVPAFWVATLFLLYASLWFDWSPPLEFKRFWDDPARNLQKMLPVALILGINLAAPTGRLVRSQMLEVLRQDYVRTARAKGLKERVVVVRHALKNAMIPVITVMGAQVGFLLGGVVILEYIFGIPGMGQITVDSILQRDYPQLQANVLVFATILVAANLIVDVTYAWFDPRIRYR